jgi:hypothetical protein
LKHFASNSNKQSPYIVGLDELQIDHFNDQLVGDNAVLRAVYHLLVDDVLQMQLYHRLELHAPKLAEPS